MATFDVMNFLSWLDQSFGQGKKVKTASREAAIAEAIAQKAEAGRRAGANTYLQGYESTPAGQAGLTAGSRLNATTADKSAFDFSEQKKTAEQTGAAFGGQTAGARQTINADRLAGLQIGGLQREQNALDIDRGRLAAQGLPQSQTGASIMGTMGQLDLGNRQLQQQGQQFQDSQNLENLKYHTNLGLANQEMAYKQWLAGQNIDLDKLRMLSQLTGMSMYGGQGSPQIDAFSKLLGPQYQMQLGQQRNPIQDSVAGVLDAERQAGLGLGKGGTAGSATAAGPRQAQTAATQGMAFPQGGAKSPVPQRTLQQGPPEAAGVMSPLWNDISEYHRREGARWKEAIRGFTEPGRVPYAQQPGAQPMPQALPPVPIVDPEAGPMMQPQIQDGMAFPMFDAPAQNVDPVSRLKPKWQPNTDEALARYHQLVEYARRTGAPMPYFDDVLDSILKYDPEAGLRDY
jgi:hypothetical protein